MALWVVDAVLMVIVLAVSVSALDEGSFWHVTDYHYDFSYSNEAHSCYKDVSVEDRGMFGNQWCDSPWKLINDSVYAMKMIEPNVDFIIWTGDNVLHTRNEKDDLSEEINLGILDNITDLLIKAFPDTVTYPAYGNHDFFPDGQFPVSESEIYRHMAASWAVWVNDTDIQTTLREGGYYTTLIRPGLRMVSLNTNLFYTSNKVVADIADPAGHFSWFDRVLTNASNSQEKVIVIGHVPPGVKVPEGFLWFYPNHNKKFNAIVSKHTDVIAAMHFGHDHQDEFKVYFDDQGKPAIPVFIGSSITPWRYIGPTKTSRLRNPGVRLVKYDRKTGRHIDYFQYYLDLAKANREGRASWDLLYRAKADYSIDDISADSLGKLRDRMLNSDDTLQAYYKRTVLWGDTESKCDQDCRIPIYCGMRDFDFQEYEKCVNMSNISPVYSSSFSLSLVWFWFVLCFIVY